VGQYQEHVEETFLEHSQRIEGVNTNLNAFQDEVAGRFKDQGDKLDKIAKNMDWLQSAEGQQALKDILIEREMGGVLDLVREVQNVLVTAAPLPRQDCSLVQKLLVVQEAATKASTKAKEIEEAMMEGDDAPEDDSWLQALNEPGFMNDLMELLWCMHVVIKENEDNMEAIEAGGGKDIFVLDNIKVYVNSVGTTYLYKNEF
jgi:hypothetical protein